MWKENRKIAFVVGVFIPLLTIPSHLLLFTGPRLAQSLLSMIIGALIVGISCYLIYRSFWAELPKESYTGDMGNRVCDRGSYALMRHPGLWWYGLLLLGLYMVSGSLWLRWAGPIWWLTDLFIVTIEDYYLYPRVFRDYGKYKKEVPFLIPGTSNVRKCISTWHTTYSQDNSH